MSKWKSRSDKFLEKKKINEKEWRSLRKKERKKERTSKHENKTEVKWKFVREKN